MAKHHICSCVWQNIPTTNYKVLQNVTWIFSSGLVVALDVSD